MNQKQLTVIIGNNLQMNPSNKRLNQLKPVASKIKNCSSLFVVFVHYVLTVTGIIIFLNLFTAYAFGQSQKLTNSSSYLISGYVQYKGWNGDGQIPFSIQIDNGKWIVLFTNTISDYIEVDCDSQRVYYLNDLERTISEKKAHGEKVGDNAATGIVIGSQVPRLPFGPCHCLGAIWLMYASDSYFRNIKGEYIEPAACLSVPSPSGKSMLFPGDLVQEKFHLVMVDNSLGVPNSIDYLVDTDPHTGKPFPSTLNEGFTNTTFRIVTTTNFNGLLFPLAAEMKTYGVHLQGDNSATLQLDHDYTVYTESISLVPPRAEYKPKLPGLTSFADARFTGSGKMQFSYVGHKWLNDQEAEESLKYSMETGDIKPENYSQYVTITMIIIFCATTVPLVFLFKNRTRGRK